MTSTTVPTADIATPTVPKDVIEAIAAMRAPVVISHVVPDADALGSAFATAMAWTDGERKPKVSLPEGSLSQRLGFMFAWADVVVATSDDFAAADGFIVLDTAKQNRCNVGRQRKETDWVAGRPIVNIDHHETNSQFGDLNWIVGDAGSTCELVFYLLRSAERRIDPTVASFLFAGMQTDTIGFSLPTTTAPALAAAAELVGLGANVGELGERLCRSQRPSEFDLLRVIYANTKLVAEGRVAYSSADFDEIRSAGCTAADIDDQINVPRSLEGVQLALLFTEGNKGRTRINFRGSGSVTVVELAAKFGGGGHAQAAGAVIEGDLQETIKKVVAAAAEHIQAFDR